MNFNKIYSLDLFRGIAGYGVAITHFYYFIYQSNFSQFLSIFFVEFFFVLSGFVLYPQLLKVYQNPKNLKIFFVRRWIRTLPPYLIALILYSYYFSKFDLDVLKHIFFIQYVKENFLYLDYFIISWSLSIEEYFYFFFPIFLFFFRKFDFLKITILFIIIIYFFKIINLFFLNLDKEYYRISTFLRLDSIAFGLLTRIFLEKILKINLNIFFFIIFSLITYFIFFKIQDISKPEIFLLILSFQLSSVSAILIFINLDKYIYSNFFKKTFNLISNQTYSIYLFHYIFILLIKENFFLMESQNIIIIYLILIFIFSSAFYNFFELDINKRRPSYSK